jgi:hypothetical protein
MHKFLGKGTCPQAFLDAEDEEGGSTKGLIKEES